MARITGRLGSASFAGAIADLVNWTIEFNVEALACAIKGEAANVVAVGGFDGRITAERFVQSSGTSTLAIGAPAQFASLPPGTVVAYTLSQIAGGGGAQIAGNAVVVRGSLNAPRDLARDTVELVLISIPTVT